MPTELEQVEHIRNDGKRVMRKLIRCDCGEEVVCAYFTNPCDCGADYNMSGERLADRSQWGWETGEHPSDVARITGEENLW